jgi:hypothetical protein
MMFKATNQFIHLTNFRISNALKPQYKSRIMKESQKIRNVCADSDEFYKNEPAVVVSLTSNITSILRYSRKKFKKTRMKFLEIDMDNCQGLLGEKSEEKTNESSVP